MILNRSKVNMINTNRKKKIEKNTKEIKYSEP